MIHMNKKHSNYARLYAALTLINRKSQVGPRWHAVGMAQGVCLEMGFTDEEWNRYCRLANDLAGDFT